MENLKLDNEAISQICGNCNTAITETEKFCSECGYPEHGTPEEKGKFQSRIGAKKRLLKIVKKGVKNAKTTLIVLGVLSALVGLYLGVLTENSDIAILVIYEIIAVVYFGLAIWSDKQPFGAILTALILYGTLVILSAVIDPVSLVSGILWKILIIGYLVKGLKSSNEARKVMDELEELGIKDA